MEEAVESHLRALEAEFGYPMTKARYDSLVAWTSDRSASSTCWPRRSCWTCAPVRSAA